MNNVQKFVYAVADKQTGHIYATQDTREEARVSKREFQSKLDKPLLILQYSINKVVR